MSVATVNTAPLASPGTGDPAGIDAELVRALLARDEAAYLALVRRYTPLMLRVARSHVRSRAAAEDVVQDTWVAVLRSVDRFEGRSTFKTWLMRILVNTARSRRDKENRTVCWGALPADAAAWETPRHAEVHGVDADPELHALAGEAWQAVERALEALPERQRVVVVLRDVEGWSSEEVCRALGVSAGNQRLLLHRGRTRLRELLVAPGVTAGRAPAPCAPPPLATTPRACGTAPGCAS